VTLLLVENKAADAGGTGQAFLTGHAASAEICGVQ